MLSAYQCLSVAPPGSRWASARALLAQNLAVVFLSLWLINTSMSAAPLLFAVGARNDSRLLQNGINVEFCFLSFPSKLSRDANGAVQVGRDVVPMALMAAASLVLLAYLLRHSRRARGLRGDGAGRVPPRSARRPHRRHARLALPAVLRGGQRALGLYADRAADAGLLAHLRPEDLLLVSVRCRQSHRHHHLQQESQ